MERFTRPASADPAFFVGWNHPWAAYGIDYGDNAWGHVGVSANGWALERPPNSQGFTDAAVSLAPVGGYRGSLRIAADLAGGHPNRSSGEVCLDIGTHSPTLCPRATVPPYLNLDGVLARVRLRLPPGSAGPASAPNHVQLFFRTGLSDERWPSLYTASKNISPGMEGTCVDLTTRVTRVGAAAVDPGVDLTRVRVFGLKVGIDPASTATLRGDIDLVEYAFETDPPTVVRFEEFALASEFRAIRSFTQGALSLARVFVFGDGRASPEFTADGTVTGFDRFFARDFEALLASAAQTQTQLIPVLLDYLLCGRSRFVNGVQLGGHASVIRQPASFLAALDQVLARYGAHPSIYAWDIMNEPEWTIRELRERVRGFEADLVGLDEMRTFVRACADLIHRRGGQVTLGSARRKWLTEWRGTGLDYYQFHYYDNFAPEEPFPFAPYGELELDMPCFVGEVPVQSTAHSPDAYVQAAQRGGYAGALLWSCRARDAFSGF